MAKLMTKMPEAPERMSTPPQSQDNPQPGFASLDAGLLARKGEALPAFSQETKLLADVGLFPAVKKASTEKDGPQKDGPEKDGGGKATKGNTAMRKLSLLSQEPQGTRTVSSPSEVLPEDRGPEDRGAESFFYKVDPDTETGVESAANPHQPDCQANESSCLHKSQASPIDAKGNRAHPSQTMARVSFRMPMADFLRLKMAGAVMEKPCREIMLDALSTYFDACDIQDFAACPCLREKG